MEKGQGRALASHGPVYLPKKEVRAGLALSRINCSTATEPSQTSARWRQTRARYITHLGGRLRCPSPHPQSKALKVAMLQMCRAHVHHLGRFRGTRHHPRLPPVSLTRKFSMHFPLSRRRFPLVQFTCLQISRKYQSVACQLSQSRAGNTNNRDCPWFETLHKRDWSPLLFAFPVYPCYLSA